MSNIENKKNNYVYENGSYYDENGNQVTVITPDDLKNADVRVVVNVAEIMKNYPAALKQSMEYGIEIGQNVGIQAGGMNKIPGSSRNQPSQITDRKGNAPAISKQPVIGVVDAFSYAAYTNSYDYERSKQFFHAPTMATENFATFDEAINWAYNECCAMNPSKRFPLLNKKNWRIMVKNIEDRGNR